MFCRNCGQQLEDNVRFCLSCGTPVVKQTPAEEQPPVQNTEFSTAEQYTQEANEPQVSLESYVEKPRDTEAVAKLKASNHSIFMLIAIALYTAVSVKSFLDLIDTFGVMPSAPSSLAASIIFPVLKIILVISMAQIALMVAGLLVNCGCSLTGYGMNTVGIKIIKSSVITRMALRGIAILGVIALWLLVLVGIDESVLLSSDSYIHITKTLTITLDDFVTLFIILGVILVIIQVVPLVHEFFILSALKSMRITAQTETVRLKGYKVVYIFNYFFAGVKAAALIILPILAGVVRGIAYDTGRKDVIKAAKNFYESAMPDVLSVIFTLLLIAAMVLFSINSSKYQKENS